MSVVSTQLDAVTEPFRATGRDSTMGAQAFEPTVIVDVWTSEVGDRFEPDANAVADTTVDPAAIAVTTPPADTVATAGLAVAYVMVTEAPVAKTGTAVNSTVWPTESVAVGGVSVKAVIAAGSATTVRSDEETCEPLVVAVIVAVPPDTPVPTQELPLTEAVAMPGFELAQVERVGTGDPPVMLTENVEVPPTFTLAVAGDMTTTTCCGGFTNPSPPPPQDHAPNALTAHAAHQLRRRRARRTALIAGSQG